MLHELHIFGPLPAAVMQEALRGLSAEPFYDDSGRFDRFRSSPPHGAHDWRPDGVQSRDSDGAQSFHPNGAKNWKPDAVQSFYPDGVQNFHPDGAQGFHPDGVQNLNSDGAQIFHSDGGQNLHSDGAQSWNPDGAQSFHPDGGQSLHPDGAQSRNPNGAQSFYADGVQSWRIRGLCGAEDRRRLLGTLLVPVREARATALLRVVGSEIRGAAFDLEGTLTELEFVDALADRLGFGERMQARTRASMTGRTRDFSRDYEERMAALRGIETAVMEEVIGSMTLAAGVDVLCAKLHAVAIPVAVISGGCSRLGEAVRQKIAARVLYATVWEERDARFTGRAASPILDPEGKRRALEDFARMISRPHEDCTHTPTRPHEDCARTPSCPREDCTRTATHPLENCTRSPSRPHEYCTRIPSSPLETLAAAGDGANDLEMLSAAGAALLTHATARPAWPEILAALL